MGLGRYENGKFHLIASLRHAADATRIAEWEASFGHASRLLSEATEGRHEIGTLTFCNDSTAGAIADLWLEPNTGRSGSTHGGIGKPGIFAHLFGDERSKPFIVVHELGHFLYHLHDEYMGTGCLGDSTADACIMEGGAGDGDRINPDGTLDRGRMRRFCVAGNHDPDHNTTQDGAHGQSCWQTMVESDFDLVLPDDLPVGANPDDSGTPAFAELVTVPRFAAVLDRSGSMLGDKLDQAKIGAHFLLDNLVNGDELALVSFASAATVDQPRHPVGDDRDAEGFAIDTLTAQGETSIGDGLRTGLEQLNSALTRSSVQSVVLLTDGLQTDGEDPSTVLPDLVRTLTRVYAVGVGPQIDAELLGRVAAVTGGEFERIDADASASDQAFALRSAMERFAVLARDGGAVTAGSAERLTDSERIVRSSVIEPGVRTATFVASWPDVKDRVELEVVSPGGRVVTESTVAPDVRIIRPDQPYVAIRISDPESGRWRARFRGATEKPELRLQRWTFVENPGLIGAVSLPATPVAPGALVRATFTVAYGRLLTGVRIGARLVGPEGTRTLRFRDGTFATEGEGEYTASFRAPQKAGVYRLTLTVGNDRTRTRFASREGVQEPVPTPPVPAFGRRFGASLVVSPVR